MQKWRIADDWPMLVLQRIDGALQLVTFKASLIIPANAVLLDRISENLSFNGDFDLHAIISTVAAILLFSSLSFAIAAVSAFLKGDHGRGDLYSTLLFFGSIAKRSPEEYVRLAGEADQDELSSDALRQVHLLSSALVAKFKQVNFSLWTLWAGILLMLVAAIV